MGSAAQRLIKRLFDLFCSAAGLLILSPLMIWAAHKIYKETGSPIFYNRLRAGKKGQPFKLYKFRTMTDERDARGNLLPDAERITAIGARIRSSSLDELPQLMNVLKGEMSLVGPRPLLMDYISLYNAEQRKRMDVPQGITGWAQINGRNAATWDERFANDLWYVKNWSLTLDLKILLLTMKKVFKREGISSESEATMPTFRGNQ